MKRGHQFLKDQRGVETNINVNESPWCFLVSHLHLWGRGVQALTTGRHTHTHRDTAREPGYVQIWILYNKHMHVDRVTTKSRPGVGPCEWANHHRQAP